MQLEPDAAPSGTGAIYDRTPDGVTHVVSLKPGDEPFGAGESAHFLGASSDGAAAAFEVGSTTYVRLNDAKTIEVGDAITFAGLSGNGARLFYLKGGNIFVLDTGTEALTQIGSGGESTLVNVSADGSRVYFSSPKQLDGSKGTVGQSNLYLWEGASPRFVATLSPADFEGRVNLGAWVGSEGTTLIGPGAHHVSPTDPSRSTPDGSVLVFESHADLIPPYEGKGHTEIYRYDAIANGGAGSLACVSCNPTEVPATASAHLQAEDTHAPLGAAAAVANLTEDGQRVFFESNERLVPRDTDGLPDVYEWQAPGAGGCARPSGCISLISAGQSASPDYLYAVTPNGSDVFIRTADSLLPSDTDGGVPSIYDARVGGGFAEPPPRSGECLGEACQPTVVTPNETTPASLVFDGPGNLLLQPVVKPKAKPTNAQKLAKALKACKKKNKRQRKRCEAQARKRYGAQAKKAVPHDTQAPTGGRYDEASCPRLSRRSRSRSPSSPSRPARLRVNTGSNRSAPRSQAIRPALTPTSTSSSPRT